MSSVLERRLAAEWDLLHQLAGRNQQRLTGIDADDLVFQLRLQETPALPLSGDVSKPQTDHLVRIVFPPHFPAAPMELYLNTPMQHPNIHPETGFVCLWHRHRVSNTCEHALHKLVAILGWRLYNGEAVHIMQPDAWARLQTSGADIVAALAASPLLGTVPSASTWADVDVVQPKRRRPRLS